MSGSTCATVQFSLIRGSNFDRKQKSYIGSIALHLFRRCAQHRGISSRPGDRVTRPDNSAVRDHRFNNDHLFKILNFNTIDSTEQVLDLKILESIHINTNRPKINNHQTDTTVTILDIT